MTTTAYQVETKEGSKSWRATNGCFFDKDDADEHIKDRKENSIYTDPDYKQYRIKPIYIK